MPIWLNHAVRPCREVREMPFPCGPGVVAGYTALYTSRTMSEAKQGVTLSLSGAPFRRFTFVSRGSAAFERSPFPAVMYRR